jgi:hypothetical protein
VVFKRHAFDHFFIPNLERHTFELNMESTVPNATLYLIFENESLKYFTHITHISILSNEKKGVQHIDKEMIGMAHYLLSD